MPSDAKPSYPSPNYGANPSPRTPCVLVLDASGSMGEPTGAGSRGIDELNRGLKALEADLKSNQTARMRVQLSIVCVGGPAGDDDADVMADWTDARDFKAFDLVPGGNTPLGKGLLLALDQVERQKQVYKARGVNYSRPWIIVISDGKPTDEKVWPDAVAACRKAESEKKCIIYPIGTEGADSDKLQEIGSEKVLFVKRVEFVELFRILSTSIPSSESPRKGWEAARPGGGR